MKFMTTPCFTASLSMVLVLFVAESFSQNASVAPQKLALIEEIRTLTGLAKFSIDQKVNASDIDMLIVRKVKSLTGVTDAGREQLMNHAVEAGKRLKKFEVDYFNDKELSDQMMKVVTINLFDKTFTEDELKEIADFYRKPVGKKLFDFNLRMVERMSKDYASANKADFQQRLQKELGNEFALLQRKIDELK